MKKLILAAALAFSTSAFAFGGNPANFPSDFPTNSGWALGMISMACNVPTSEMKGLTGSISDVQNGVVYEAENSNGEVVLSASAKNTSIFAKKTCLD
ncbi:MAG: hypothetical protein AAF202_02955 [Pseudomonadota bacterium]